MEIVLTAVIGLSVAYAAFGKASRQQNWSIIKTYRPVQFLTSLVVVAIVIGAAIALTTQVPYFDKNPFLWLASKLFGWGNGNGGANLTFSGIQWKWYALIYLPVLMFALPSLAKYEEEKYRNGTRNWFHGVLRSIRFGLAHLIMLIPFGTALALSIGGLWFTHQYFKGGTTRSTTYHAVYNSMLVAALFATLFFIT
jgi:hypothetical protein